MTVMSLKRSVSEIARQREPVLEREFDDERGDSVGRRISAIGARGAMQRRSDRVSPLYDPIEDHARQSASSRSSRRSPSHHKCRKLSLVMVRPKSCFGVRPRSYRPPLAAHARGTRRVSAVDMEAAHDSRNPEDSEGLFLLSFH